MLDLPTEVWSAYRRRIEDEFGAGWITRSARDVLVAIANLNMAGDFDPTIAKIAVEAKCGRRTVQRARALAEARGLLHVLAQFNAGWQGTNRYALVLPEAPVTPKPASLKGRQSGTPNGKKEEREERKRARQREIAALTPLAARNALAAIAARRTLALGLSP